MKPGLFTKMRFLICMQLFAPMVAAVFGQSRTITGTIVDENGETLPGVTVAIEGTNRVVSTGIDGNYSISTYS